MLTAKEIAWSGVTAIELRDSEANTAALMAPGLGANLFSLTDGDREVLRRPPDANALRETPTRWGIPVLLPTPGRVTGGRFVFDGREYQLETRPGQNWHIHGFALKRAWEVKEFGVTPAGARVTLVFRAADYPDVLSQFPHPFVFTLTYTLKGRVLQASSHISNEGDTSMPFGLGFHHYFAAPDDGTEAATIRVEGTGRQWEMVDDIPTGRFHAPTGVEDLRTWQPVHAMRRDAGYTVTEPRADGGSRAELTDSRTGLSLRLDASAEFGHWVIFNGRPGFEGFICLEPYTCMSNAFNLDLPAAESGMSVVAPRSGRTAGDWTVSWVYNR